MSDPEIEALEQQIAQTRAGLADTVDALDGRLKHARETTTKVAIWGGAAAATGLVVLIVVRRLRARKG